MIFSIASKKESMYAGAYFPVQIEISKSSPREAKQKVPINIQKICN